VRKHDGSDYRKCQQRGFGSNVFGPRAGHPDFPCKEIACRVRVSRGPPTLKTVMQRVERTAFQAVPNGSESHTVCQFRSIRLPARSRDSQSCQMGSTPICFTNFALLDQLAESTRLERVQSRFESEGEYQSSAMRSGCSQVVKAGLCDSSIHGFESRQSPLIVFQLVAERRGCRLQSGNTLVQIQSSCPNIWVWDNGCPLALGARLSTFDSCHLDQLQGLAQPGRALGPEPSGRRFKSCIPDQSLGE
jgi:hypothetical protein